jgi:hypothetical protein
MNMFGWAEATSVPGNRMPVSMVIQSPIPSSANQSQVIQHAAAASGCRWYGRRFWAIPTGCLLALKAHQMARAQNTAGVWIARLHTRASWCDGGSRTAKPCNGRVV